MHLTSFGPGFRAFRCTQPSPNPHDQHTPDARLGQTHLGDVKDAIHSGALGSHPTRLFETIRGCKRRNLIIKHSKNMLGD